MPAKPRGSHLVTDVIVDALPEVRDVQVGLLHLFLQHTSAALTINENADPDVRSDMAMALDRLVPEDWPYRHTAEGADDMPAHVKTALVGPSLMIPIAGGKLALGTWQGIYLCEFRDNGGSRRLVATILA